MSEIQKTYNCIVICGPTASGKTSVAAEVSRRFGCEIISADSRQVYRGMTIGSGKDLDDYVLQDGYAVPYHLIDIADPREVYSLYRYLEDFYRAFTDISARGKIPMVCGGSGLYLEAALKRFEIANVPEDAGFRNEKMLLDTELLLQELSEFPEIMAKTDFSSKKRIVRSLEVAEFSRHSEVEYSSADAPLILPLVFCFCGDSAERNSKIDRRLEARLGCGMIEEVKQLLDSGVSFERMQMLGLEYRWISLYLAGRITYDEMKETLANEIHRFAKRQMTWFRGMEKRGMEINWIQIADRDAMVKNIESILENSFRHASR